MLSRGGALGGWLGFDSILAEAHDSIPWGFVRGRGLLCSLSGISQQKGHSKTKPANMELSTKVNLFVKIYFTCGIVIYNALIGLLAALLIAWRLIPGFPVLFCWCSWSALSATVLNIMDLEQVLKSRKTRPLALIFSEVIFTYSGSLLFLYAF